MTTSRTHTQYLTHGVPEASLVHSLLERISEGRMGITYSTHVISATANDGSDITNLNTFSESICLNLLSHSTVAVNAEDSAHIVITFE